MAPEQNRPHNPAVIRCLCSCHSRTLLKTDGQFLSPISKVKIQAMDQSTSAMGALQDACRATGIVPMVGASAHLVSSIPDPEIAKKKSQHKFTAKYKLRILAQADACIQPG